MRTPTRMRELAPLSCRSERCVGFLCIHGSHRCWKGLSNIWLAPLLFRSERFVRFLCGMSRTTLMCWLCWILVCTWPAPLLCRIERCVGFWNIHGSRRCIESKGVSNSCACIARTAVVSKRKFCRILVRVWLARGWVGRGSLFDVCTCVVHSHINCVTNYLCWHKFRAVRPTSEKKLRHHFTFWR